MTKTDQKWLWVLLIFSVFYNAPQALAQENSQYIKCEKNLMLSSRIGVQKKKQGTELFKYVPNQYLCEVSDLEKGKCYVRYQGASWLERDDAIIGFDKSPKYPRDSTVIVLDLKSLEFYKTVKQVEMRYTIWGKCQFIAKPIIKGAKQVWMIMEFFNGFKAAEPASKNAMVTLRECKKSVNTIVKIFNSSTPDTAKQIKQVTCVESVSNPINK